MYKTYLLLAALFGCFAANAKKEYTPRVIRIQDTVVGSSLRDNKPLYARRYNFGDSVYQFYSNANATLLTIQLISTNPANTGIEENGEILEYDKANNRINWSKATVYTAESYYQVGYLLLCKTQDNAIFINPANGIPVFQTQLAIYYADPDKNIALAYDHNDDTDSIYGIDLHTGSVLWSRKIDRTYGFEVAEVSDDSSVLVKASGLHNVNLYTGKGWDYNAAGGKTNVTAAIAKGTAKLLLDVLTEDYGDIGSGKDLISASSNVLRDDDRNIYFASIKTLTCLSPEGKLLWHQEIPKGISNSILRISGNNLYLFSLGMSTINQTQVKQKGRQFVAAFDKKNGAEQFNIDPQLHHIQDLMLDSGTIMVMDNSEVCKYSASDGHLIIDNRLSKKKLVSFALSSFFVNNTTTTLLPLADKEPGRDYVMTQKDIMVIDDSLNATGSISEADIYTKIWQYGDYMLLRYRNEMVLGNAYGDIIARMEVSNHYLIDGNKLLFSKGSCIYEIDLSPLLQ